MWLETQNGELLNVDNGNLISVDEVIEKVAGKDTVFHRVIVTVFRIDKAQVFVVCKVDNKALAQSHLARIKSWLRQSRPTVFGWQA